MRLLGISVAQQMQQQPGFMQQLLMMQNILSGRGCGDIPITFSNGVPGQEGVRQVAGRPMRSIANTLASANLRRAHTVEDDIVDAPEANAEEPAHEGGIRDSIAEVSERMLSREPKLVAVEEESDVEPQAVERVRKKPAAEPELTPKHQHAKKQKTTPTKESGPIIARGGYWSKPHIGFERSCHQVMCRSGKLGRGSTSRIPFKGHGGEQGAWKKAEEWLKKEMKEYNKYV
jgi:hypothetical protein